MGNSFGVTCGLFLFVRLLFCSYLCVCEYAGIMHAFFFLRSFAREDESCRMHELRWYPNFDHLNTRPIWCGIGMFQSKSNILLQLTHCTQMFTLFFVCSSSVSLYSLAAIVIRSFRTVFCCSLSSVLKRHRIWHCFWMNNNSLLLRCHYHWLIHIRQCCCLQHQPLCDVFGCMSENVFDQYSKDDFKWLEPFFWILSNYSMFLVFGNFTLRLKWKLPNDRHMHTHTHLCVRTHNHLPYR